MKISKPALNRIAGSDRAKDLWVIAGIALLIILYFSPALFSGKMIWGWDTANQYYYWRSWVFGSLRQGHIPLWNPYSFAGYPIHTDPQQGIFYPLNAVFLIFPAGYAITISFTLHVILAAVWVFLFCRLWGVGRLGSMAGGIIFGLNGFMVGRFLLGSLPQLCAFSWTGLLFLLIEKGIRDKRILWFFLGGVVNGMQMLAGHPQLSYYLAISSGVYFVFRALGVMISRERSLSNIGKLAAGFILLWVIGIGLAAIQYLPTLSFVFGSTRGGGLDMGIIGSSSLPPIQLITLLIPEFFGNEVQISYWGHLIFVMSVMYTGLGALVLAFTGLFRRPRNISIFLLLLGAMGLILAMGWYTPLWSIFWNFVPGTRYFRLISRWLVLFEFGVAVLAAFGIDCILGAGTWGLKRRWLPYFWTILFFAGIALELAFILFWIPLVGQEVWSRFIQNFMLSKVESQFNVIPLDTLKPYLFSFAAYNNVRLSMIRPMILIFVMAFGFLLTARKKISAAAFAWCMAIFVLVDLIVFGYKFVIPYDTTQIDMPKEMIREMKSTREPCRSASLAPQSIFPYPVSSMRNYYAFSNQYNQSYMHWGMPDSIENIAGNYSLMDLRYTRFTLVEDPDTNTFENNFLQSRRTFDTLGTRYLLLPKGQKPPRVLAENLYPLQKDFGNISIWINERAFAKAILTHTAYFAEEPVRAIRCFERPIFNPETEVVLEKPPDPGAQSGPYLPFIKYHIAEKDALMEYTHVKVYEPERVVVETQLMAPGYLVLFDRFDNGWTATANNKPVKIVQADYLFRAVALPAGRFEVEFNYRPKAFIMGAWISGGVLIFIVVMSGFFCVAAWRRRYAGAGQKQSGGHLEPQQENQAKVNDMEK